MFYECVPPSIASDLFDRLQALKASAVTERMPQQPVLRNKSKQAFKTHKQSATITLGPIGTAITVHNGNRLATLTLYCHECVGVLEGRSYFGGRHAASDDGKLVDGKRTVVTGAHASRVQAFLHGCGLACNVLDRGEFTEQMLEKLIWSSVLWLVCHVHGGLTVRF
jgi:ribosomal protein S19